MIVGRAEIGVAVAAVDLHPAKLVNQIDVENTGDRIGAVNRGGAVLQQLGVIDEADRNRVKIDGVSGKADRRETSPILKDKGLFWKNAS